MLIMGNFCSICIPKRSSKQSRPSSLQYQETSGDLKVTVLLLNWKYCLPGLHPVPSDLGACGDSSPQSNNVQCHVSRSSSQVPVSKSETFSLLGNHQHQPGPGATSTIKSDKRSLASKLSGTLNRANSGNSNSIYTIVLTWLFVLLPQLNLLAFKIPLLTLKSNFSVACIS